jgi:hypothetical protein
VGQAWQDGRCAGEAARLDLMDAQARVEALNAQGHEGITQWRLPTIVELAALRRCDHGFVGETFTLALSPEKDPVNVPRWCAGETTTPTIDTARFPDTPPVKFWSGSGSEADQHFYAVNFGNAWIGLNEAAESAHAVRPSPDLRSPGCAPARVNRCAARERRHAGAQIGEDRDAAHQRRLRILGDDRVHRAVDQQRARIGRQAVADEDDLVLRRPP